MAIYQFQLVIIPKAGIQNKFGYLPTKLEINYKKRTDHFYLKKEGLLNSKEDYRDALTQDWWSSINLNPMEVVHQIDKYVTRASYGSDIFINWKSNSNNVDNDASLLLNSQSHNIEILRFRADLREKKLIFLNQMIELAKDYKCMLMDMTGNLINPNINEVGNLIKESNSYRYIKDPLKFIDDIDKGQLIIE